MVQKNAVAAGLQQLEKLSDDVAKRAHEEFSELPEDVKEKIMNAATPGSEVFAALRKGAWEELRSALLRLHNAHPSAGYGKLANEVLRNLG